MEKKVQTLVALLGATTVYVLYTKLVLLGTLPFLLGVCIFVFVVIPVIFRYSYTLQRSMLFLNFVRWPRTVNYSAPEKLGLEGTRNFYVTTNDNVHLGAWHILPSSLVNRSKDADGHWFEDSLSNGLPIVLYMHGNSASRASPHRVELYNVLRALNYHVIAFDYRSYADSSPVEPSEPGLVSDGEYMYNWAKHRAKGAPLFVWGHSLGTGISSHVLANLGRQGTECLGLILESPFNNMRDEIRCHPFAKPFVILPWFEACFVQPMEENGLKFDTDDHVKHFKAPIMILHAEDDRVVPYKLGVKLYNSAKKTRSDDSGPVELKTFKAELGHGHKYICRDPGLPDIVKNFIEESLRRPLNKSAQN